MWQYLYCATHSLGKCNKVWQACNRNTELDTTAISVLLLLPIKFDFLRDSGRLTAYDTLNIGLEKRIFSMTSKKYFIKNIRHLSTSCAIIKVFSVDRVFARELSHSGIVVIWWHRSGLILAQIMACCLTAPSRYLNQYWLITSGIQ